MIWNTDWDSGSVLVQKGNKSLPDPMLTPVCDILCCQQEQVLAIMILMA